jgi:hypothetical protein
VDPEHWFGVAPASAALAWTPFANWNIGWARRQSITGTAASSGDPASGDHDDAERKAGAVAMLLGGPLMPGTGSVGCRRRGSAAPSRSG